MQTFRANGKLLLSGEYAILDGAKGLALPTRFGQTLVVDAAPVTGIQWTAMDREGKVWFRCSFLENLDVEATTDPVLAETLKKVLQAIIKITGNRLPGFSATTRLEFPTDWGLGSSSTLISLLAQHFQCDPYELLAQTFGGSGYDIACATANGPITYQKTEMGRIIQPAAFDPGFKEDLYFLHLGKKQNTREGIQHYRNSVVDKAELAEQITDITQKLLQAAELDEFCYYLDLHEVLISRALQLSKVKDTLFSDFPGSVKSLGAWGGDFICVASDEDESNICRYFIDKGYRTLLKYSEVILP